jgi:iron complex transport system substrate-binding protein
MRKAAFRTLTLVLTLLLLGGCASTEPTETPSESAETPLETVDVDWDALEFDQSMELLYADQFTVDYSTDGYKRITIADTDVYLVVPEGAAVPNGVPDEITVLQQPLDSIYMVATSAMDMIRQLDAIDNVRLSGLDASGWYIEEAKQAMEAGRMVYAGKYSAPDYECILSNGCDLAVESTMIYHNPEVKEQLEKLGIPVLVERSSYESHPLGRMEWVKLYAALLDKEDMAQDYFAALLDRLSPILEQENTGKTVAYFYVTSIGAVNVRKSGDYIAKAIDLAGGKYIFPDLAGDDNALSTMNMQMESFYDGAKDADVLIYNSSIDGELWTVDELLDKSAVFANFKAVQEGNVWCTGQNMFQESLGLGDMIQDIHTILTQPDVDDGELTYLHRVQ